MKAWYRGVRDAWEELGTRGEAEEYLGELRYWMLREPGLAWAESGKFGVSCVREIKREAYTRGFTAMALRIAGRVR